MISIEEYKEENRQEWENFVDNSNNGTMFHKIQFLDYHYQGKFDFKHYIFRRNGKIIAVLPGGIKDNGKTYWSPIGASYGSFVTDDIHYSDSLDIVDAFLKYAKENGYEDVYLIPPPFIYNKNYNQHLEYSMLYRKFDFELHYISHAIDLKHGDDFLKYFDKTSRKTLHKILREKKLSIVESDDYETFYKILIENKSRHNVKPTHSLEDMIKIRELMPENVKLFMVYYNDIPIAGSWLFLCNSNVVLCFYNMLLYEYEELKPIYLIMYETVRWSIANNYKWVDIGVSQDTKAEDPMTPSLNLIQFKERFDARGVLRTTYHFKLSN